MSHHGKVLSRATTGCGDVVNTLESQRGAALVIVMVMLTGALMLGVVGVQSALVDQRQATNYRASLKAQMRAESAAAEALSVFDSLDWEGASPLAADESPRWAAFDGRDDTVHACHERACLYVPVLRRGERWVLALGVVRADSTLAAHSEPVFVRRAPPGEEDPRAGATFLWD